MTLIEIAKDQGYLDDADSGGLLDDCHEVVAMLNGLMDTLR